MASVSLVDEELVERAHSYLQTVLLMTPCEFSPSISSMLRREVWIKWELALPTRSFKVRGALFKTKTLSCKGSQNPDGLATASTGNHGLGVAYAARVHDYPATVFVPLGANTSKVRAIRSLGAAVVPVGSDWHESYEYARAVCTETGLTYVHSFDDPAIIAGQASIGVEIAEQVPEADTVVVPIGGGGLIAGIATALAMRSPATKVIGVQPAGADAMRQSIEVGHPVTIPPFTTIADGLGARCPGQYTFEITSRLVNRVAVVHEPAIRQAMAILLREERFLVEPSAAISLAALIEAGKSIPGDRVVCVISGGNVDPALLHELVTDAYFVNDSGAGVED